MKVEDSSRDGVTKNKGGEVRNESSFRLLTAVVK